MDRKCKKPKIRFVGFSDAWEQLNLGENSEILTGGTPSTSIEKYWEPKQIPWMSSGEINKKRLLETNNRISEDGFHNSSAKWVRNNSVLIALAGQGKTRGTVAINEIPLTTNQSIAAIMPGEDIHYEFLFQNLEKRYEELRKNSSGDGTRGGLNKQIISEVMIPSPIIDEQIRIGLFFKKMDKLISLQQNKYDKLIIVKKTMLEKMFPNDGANVPEIRFSGFTGDWEQSELGEIVEDNQIPIPMPEAEYTRLGIRSHARGTFHEKVPMGKGLAVDTMYLVEANNLIVNITFAWEHAVAITDEEDAGKLVSHRFPQYKFREGYDPYFFKYSMLDNKFKYSLGLASPGGAGRNRVLNKSEFLKIKRTAPKLFEEQKIIGEFFLCLDRLISIQKRRLEKLKIIKKSMLEKMFV